MTKPKTARKRPYAPELDGIRALAVWMVLLVHAGAPGFAGGWVGVDVFFVMSGFLITTLLIGESERYSNVSFRNFIIRRSLRLLPAYFTYIVPVTIFFILSPAATKHDHAGWTPLDLVVSLWTYTVNFLPLGGIWDYQYLTRHLWSLAVEQQFYLVLPLVFLISLRTRIGLGTLLVLTLALFWGLSHTSVIIGSEKASLFARGSSLFIGCLAASFSRQVEGHRSEGATDIWLARLHRTGVVLSVICVAFILWSNEVSGEQVFGRLSLESLTLYVALAVGVSGYWYGWSGFGSKFLRLPALVTTGRISYGIYIYHMLSWMLIFDILDDYLDISGSRYLNYGLKVVVYIALAHAIAALSYRLIETPFLRLKRFFAERAPRRDRDVKA